MYANADAWTPQQGLAGCPAQEINERSELDRWLISMLQSLVASVNEQMEGYYLYKVVPVVLEFIDHMTNWYIRRSRRRFWSPITEESKQDKANAYATLYHCLVEFSKVLAPVLPFLSEAMYQHLVVEMGVAQEESVHLCDYPVANPALIDAELEKQVAYTREVVSLGRALREKHKLKTRQPLQAVTLVHHDAGVREAFAAQAKLIGEELNVKEVRIEESDAQLTSVSFQANFKTLGKRCGKQMKEVANAIAGLSRAAWKQLQSGASIQILEFEIQEEDVIVRREAKADVVIETQGALLVALDTEVNAQLLQEGYVRETVRSIQQFRKDSGLEISDRIKLEITSADPALCGALEAFVEQMCKEVLADSIVVVSAEPSGQVVDINDIPARLRLV
jgi:isoleucyl-tRNA synthetase